MARCCKRALAEACAIVRNVCNRSQSHRAGWRHGERSSRGHSAATRERGDVILLFYVSPEVTGTRTNQQTQAFTRWNFISRKKEHMIHSRNLRWRGKIFLLQYFAGERGASW